MEWEKTRLWGENELLLQLRLPLWERGVQSLSATSATSLYNSSSLPTRTPYPVLFFSSLLATLHLGTVFAILINYLHYFHLLLQLLYLSVLNLYYLPSIAIVTIYILVLSSHLSLYHTTVLPLVTFSFFLMQRTNIALSSNEFFLLIWINQIRLTLCQKVNWVGRIVSNVSTFVSFVSAS